MTLRAPKKVTHDLWALADALGVDLKIEGEAVRGEAKKNVVFGALLLPVPVKVVSSLATDRGAALFCQSLGNVSMLAVSGHPNPKDLFIYIVDLAKMNKSPINWMESHVFFEIGQVLSELKKRSAIAAVFQWDTKNWKRCSLADYLDERKREAGRSNLR